MRISYQWEDFNNPKLLQLRKEFNLNIIKQDKSEFNNQLLLKDWVYKTFQKGTPKEDYSHKSTIDILSDAKNGFKFWCTQYAFTYLQCGTALGWYVRKLGVDSDHRKEEQDMHHGVVDIWSNQFNKWYVIDPLHNLHYEKNGIPLNSLEIRTEYLKNKNIDIKGIFGISESKIIYKEDSKGFNTPSNYFWFFISLRNNFFENPGLFDVKALLWVDKKNKDKKWYKNNEDHPMYKNQFIETDDIEISFPNLLHKLS